MEDKRPQGRPTKYTHDMPALTKGRRGVIYALTCPESGNIRYVGQAVNYKRRYSEHCRNVGRASGDSYYQRWMASLNSSPGIIVLQESSNLNKDERLWIEKLSKKGVSLVNTGKGGEGYPENPVYHLARKMRSMFGRSSRIEELVKIMISTYRASDDDGRAALDKKAFDAMEGVL